jgi:hypothetical protein
MLANSFVKIFYKIMNFRQKGCCRLFFGASGEKQLSSRGLSKRADLSTKAGGLSTCFVVGMRKTVKKNPLGMYVT